MQIGQPLVYINQEGEECPGQVAAVRGEVIDLVYFLLDKTLWNGRALPPRTLQAFDVLHDVSLGGGDWANDPNTWRGVL